MELAAQLKDYHEKVLQARVAAITKKMAHSVTAGGLPPGSPNVVRRCGRGYGAWSMTRS